MIHAVHEMKKIRELALKNAVQHNGTADPKAVLTSLLSQDPDLRKKAKDLLEEVKAEVKKVNALEKKEQQEEFAALGGKIEKRKKEKKELPPLSNADKYKQIVLRFEPSPSGPLHLGHARAMVLNDEYAQRYKGKLILRISDTNAKSIDPRSYKKIPEDLQWMECTISETHLQSDRIKTYQEHMRMLISSGDAYACNCAPEKFKKAIDAKKPCPCRDLPPDEHAERWEKMLTGGTGYVVRIKTDLSHKNPAIRDWPAFRVVAEKHPRSDERAWPLMNFAVAVDDHLMGITHVLRGKDHLDNTERQGYLFKHFKWNPPEYVHYGRMNLDAEISLSKRKIRKAIEEGMLAGWEDARLPTLEVLRKRGIQARAIRQAMKDVGVKQVDLTFSWENLYSINRKQIEPDAERYFFVERPVKIRINGAPAKQAKIPKHPMRPELGHRKYSLKENPELWVSEKDLKSKGPIRLKDLYNVQVHSRDLRAEYTGAEKIDPKIQWVKKGIPCQVHMPNGELLEGLAEDECAQLKTGQIIQFERFGFVRVTGTGKRITAYYTHK